MQLSQRCLSIAASLTLEIDAQAKRMRAEGLDVIGFGAGEPDFDTPSFIKDAAKEALDKGMTKYTPASGTAALKQAVCDKFRRDNGLSYEPAQIVISNGAKHSLFNAFAALLNPGDEVIIPSPCWGSYPELVKINGGTPVFVEAGEKNGFVPTIEEIRAAVTPRTKALVINSPSNPCGYVFSREFLQQVAELACEKDFAVISDEIYEKLVYDGAQHVSIASLGEDIKERTIVINGMSKAYAMTGWRIGYAAASLKIAKVMGNLQSHATSNPNSMAQFASVAALNGPTGALDAMVEEFDRRRRYMVERINSIPGLSCLLPHGAFYVMLNITGALGKTYKGKEIHSSLSFCSALLEGEKVAIVPGIAFEADDFCRLSYATSMANIQEGLNRLAEFMGQLQ